MTRSNMPTDPAATVRALRVCRDAMIEVHKCVKPMGPAYHAAAMVISAIDGFATFFTGQRYYFSAHESSIGEELTHEEKMAQESGEKLWPT